MWHALTHSLTHARPLSQYYEGYKCYGICKGLELVEAFPIGKEGNLCVSATSLDLIGEEGFGDSRFYTLWHS